MNKNKIIKKGKALFVAIASLSFLISCQPEEVGTDNGLTATTVDASFTIAVVEGKTNTYLLGANSKDALKSIWNIGKGLYAGKMLEEISLPDAGTYTITHTAIGRGGTTNTVSQQIIVAKSDPEKGNLVKGGRFATAADVAQWQVLNLNTNGAAGWTFNSGSATIHSTGGWAQEGIYQAVDVVKDKEYTIDMMVSSGSGSNETWFEVYAGKTVPVSGVEYKDNKVMGLSTWDGCATGAFDGILSIVGCVKNDVTKTVSNVVKFDTTGKIYLVIRCGGNIFTPDGITVTDVELRGK